MSITHSVASFIDHRKRKNVAPATVLLYTRVLTSWAGWRSTQGLPGTLASVGLDDFALFLGGLTEAGRKPNTVDSYRRTLRAFWRYLAGEGLLSENQRGIWANGRIPRPLGLEPEARPYCDDDTFNQLLDAVGDGADEQSARDRAILLLLWESGMRVSELCSLTDGAVQLRNRRAEIVGKGRKRGWVFWGPGASAAILRYLPLRRGARGGPLFRGVSSRNNGGPMTPNAVRLVVKHLGVDVPKSAPVHFLRHAFAHRALNRGLEVSQVQQLMRHSNIETTLRYLKERPDKLQELHRTALGLNLSSGRKRAHGE